MSNISSIERSLRKEYLDLHNYSFIDGDFFKGVTNSYMSENEFLILQSYLNSNRKNIKQISYTVHYKKRASEKEKERIKKAYNKIKEKAVYFQQRKQQRKKELEKRKLEKAKKFLEMKGFKIT